MRNDKQSQIWAALKGGGEVWLAETLLT